MAAIGQSRPEERYEVGVLLVHGIGESRRGDTLVGFGGPIVECLQSLLTGGKRGSHLPPGTPGITEVRPLLGALGEDPSAPAHAEVTIRNIGHLRDPASSLASRPDSRWLLAEGWWGESFPVPTLGAIARWGFQALPWTLIGHFDQRLRRRGFRVLNGWDLPARLQAALLWLLDGAFLLLALVLSPMIVALVFSLVLAGALPVSWLRDLVGAAQRFIARFIGDSFVLLDEPISRGAILERVRRDLEWLASRCRRVVIVAHSQGAAIAHEVVRGDPLTPCDELITFGSGLRKLSEIELAQETKAGKQLAFATASSVVSALALGGLLWKPLPLVILFAAGPNRVVAAGVAALSIAEAGLLFLVGHLVRRQGGSIRKPPTATGDDTDANPADGLLAQITRWLGLAVFVTSSVVVAELLGAQPSQWALVLVYALGLAATWLAYRKWQSEAGRAMTPDRQWRIDRKRFLERFRFPNDRVAWLDVFSVSDFVPNGALLDENHPEGLFSFEIVNQRSLLFDHTSYWANKDDFVRPLVRRVLRHADILLERQDPAADDRAWRTRLRRRWRVGWLVAARWIVVVNAALVLVVWRAQPPHWLRAASVGIGSALKDLWWIGPSLAAGADEGMRSPVSVVLFLLIFGALYGAIRILWGAWDGREVRQIFERKDHAFCDVTLSLALLVPLAWSALAGSVIDGRLAWIAATPLLVAIAVSPPRSRKGLLARTASGPLDKAIGRIRDHRQARLEAAVNRGNSWAAFELGRMLIGSEPERGIKQWQQAIMLGSADAAWFLGQHLEGRNDLPGARAAYESGVRLGDGLSAYFLGGLLKKADDLTGAVAAFERGLELGHPGAAHSLGLLLEGSDPERAIQVYERGIALGDHLSAEWSAGLLKQRAEGRRAQDPAAAEADLRKAEWALRRAVELGSARAAVELGAVFESRGDFAQARRSLELGVRLRSDQAAFELGELLSADGETEAARSTYERAVEFDDKGKTTAYARERLAQLLEKGGRSEAAKRMYALAMGQSGQETGSREAALRLGNIHQEAALKPGDILQKWQALDEAAASFRRGIELESPECAVKLGDLLDGRFDKEGARQAFSRGIELGSGESAVRLGALLESHFVDRAGAQAAYRKGVELFSREALARLIKILELEGDVLGARELTERTSWIPDFDLVRLGRLIATVDEGAGEAVLRRASEHSREADVALGRLLEARGDLAGAREAYRRGMERYSGEAAHELGRILEREGDQTGAAEAYRNAELWREVKG